MRNEEGFLKVTGGKIWYKVLNKTNQSTPLIIVHGGPGSSSRALLPIHKLAKDRTVVFYDQLGCGKSERPKDKKLWEKERFVSELEILRKHLNFKKMYLLGGSWGTMLSALYALRYPKRVKGMILSGPFFSTTRWINDTNKLKRSLPIKVQEVIEKHEAAGTTDSKEYEKATLEFYKKFLCRIYPFPKPLREGFKQQGADVYNTMWGPSEFHCNGNLKGTDLTGKLKDIKVPVFLICGKYDMARPETTKYYNSLFPDSRMVVLKRSSHIMFLEEKDSYIKLARKFLKSI